MCFVSGGLARSPHAPAGHRSLLALRWLQTQGLVHEHVRGCWEGRGAPQGAPPCGAVALDTCAGKGLGQPGTGVSLQQALGCPELCLATGVSSWHTPATWAQASPYSMFWDTWRSDSAQGSSHGMHWDSWLGMGVSTWPLSAQSCGWAWGSPHGVLQDVRSSCQAWCREPK